MIRSKYFNIARLLHNEHRSIDELIHYQTIALKKLVRHAYDNVLFYKKLFDQHGFHPDNLRTIEDISLLPIIDKELLAQNSYDQLISKKYKMNSLIPVKTAGSNGTPYLFYIDHSFDQFRKAQFLRPYFTNGRRLFDHSVSFSVSKSKPVKWFNRIGLMSETRIFSGSDINYQIEVLKQVKPDIIQGYGSVLNLLSSKIIEDNVQIIKPRLIFTDSELLMPEMRENIEKAFCTKVYDIYGTFETDNIAYQCSRHEGYHIAVDCVILELIKNYKPIDADQEGEIVVTVLNNFAMPFIRYNLHDIGSLGKKICSCGRTFPLLNQISGRASDYLVTEDDRKLSVFNLGGFAGLAPNVCEYQIIQEDFNLFTILIVPNKSYNNEGKRKIIPAIKHFFPRAEINVNLVPSIKREPSGKFKAFKSNINSV